MGLEIGLKSYPISPSDFELIEVEEKKLHINDLPDEILDVILNECGLSDLDRVSAGEACPLWGRLVRYPYVAQYGADVWKENFGYTVQGEIPLPPSPVKILKTLILLEGKLEKTGCMLALIPGGLTLNELISLMASPQSGHAIPISQLCDKITQEFGNKAVDLTCWVLFTENVVSGTRYKSHVAQESFIKEKTNSLCGLPELIVAVACVALKRVKMEKPISRDRPLIWTRCVEKFDNRPLIVGGFSSGNIEIFGDAFDSGLVGVEACRKFK